HPGGAAAAQVELTGPTRGAGFSRSWDGPKAPSELPGLGVIGGNETADAVVAARSSDENFIFDDKRSAGGPVILVAFGVGNVPEEMTGAGIETQEVGIVGLEKNAIAPKSDTSTVVLGSIVNEAFGNRARIVPD